MKTITDHQTKAAAEKRVLEKLPFIFFSHNQKWWDLCWKTKEMYPISFTVSVFSGMRLFGGDLSWRIFFAVYELRIITLMTMCIWADLHRGWKGPSDDEGPVRAWRSLCTHLLAAVRGVHSVVQAGFVSKTEHFLKQVFAEVLKGWVEDKVAYLCVLLVAVMAEVDEVLDVVVGSNVLDILTKTD